MASIIDKLASPLPLPSILLLSFLTIAGSGCAKDEDTLETRLARANDYFAADQYDKATTEYREVLRLAPTDPVALRRLGIIYHDQGQIVQAYPLLKEATELLPEDSEAQLKFGLTFLSLGQFAEARDSALQVLDKQPGDEQALVLLADTAGSPANTVEEIRTLVHDRRTQDHDRPGYHLALGSLDLRQKEEVRAEGEFKRTLELDPRSGAAHSALGVLYWTRNDLKAAEQEFKAAADLVPGRSPIRMRYADFLLRTGSADAGKAILEEINRKIPDYLPPRVYLMRMACAKAQDEDCTARVQNILAQDAINYDALLQDAIMNLAKGETAKAIRELEQLASIYTQNPQVRYQLARAYLQFAKTATPVNSGNAFDSADSNLSTAVQLAPQFEQAVVLLAELKIRKGTPAAAVDLLVPLTRDRPQIAPAHYLLATAYLAQEDLAQTLAVYQKMTELFPQDPQPQFLTGTILLTQNRLQDARQAFEKSVAASPNYLPAIERLVDIDVAEQKYGLAMERVQAQIDRDPKLAQPWALRGKIYLAQRDFMRAEPDLLKAIEIDANLEPAYLLLSQLYVITDQPDKAIYKLKTFTEKNKNPTTLMQLALIYERTKNFPAARDTYNTILTAAPDFAAALNNLAVLNSEQFGQLDAAYDLAKRAHEAAPNEPHLADTFGWIQFKRGEYSNALAMLQESAVRLPDQPQIQSHLGSAQYMLGQDEAARPTLKKAVDATVEFTGKDEARRRLAILAIEPQSVSAVDRNELQSYLKDRPNDPVALSRLAEIQMRDGANDEAVKSYEKIVATNPQFAPATRRLAMLYKERNVEDSKAFELTEKARQAYPQDENIAKVLGILNYRRQYYPRAAELLQEAARVGVDDPELQFYLGAAHYQLKQWNQCKAVLERALTLNPAPKLAEEARRISAECSEINPQ